MFIMSKELETKQPKTTKEKVIFGAKIGGNVLFYAVIVFLFLFSLMNINSAKTNGIPNLFGKGILSVQSDSMKRSDKNTDLPEWADYSIGGFETGDLVVVKVFKESTTKNLKVGDVITFYDAKLEALNTHRIVYINENGQSVITQGDSKAEIQPFKKNDPFGEENGNYNYQLEASGAIETVSVSNIKGVVVNVKAGAGKTLDNVQQNWLIYFVLPVAILLLFEVYMVIKNVLELKNEKQKAELASDKEAMLAELEAEKEKMRQELLAELMAKQNQQTIEVVEEDKPEDNTNN